MKQGESQHAGPQHNSSSLGVLSLRPTIFNPTIPAIVQHSRASFHLLHLDLDTAC